MMRKKRQSIFVFVFLVVFTLLLAGSVSAEGYAQALQLGKKVSGEITEEISQQSYVIDLREPGFITVDFSSYIERIVDVELLDSNGKEIFDTWVMDAKKNNPKKMTKSEYVEAGLYYINIVQINDDTGMYELEVNHQPTQNNEIEPNNGTVQAQPLSFDEKFTGLISWSDDLDTYKIVLDQPGLVTVDFSSYIKNNVGISLEDAKGKDVFARWVSDGTAANPKQWDNSEYLEAGTYFVKVYQVNDSTGKYDLVVNHQAVKNHDVEPNNGTVEAQPIALNQKLTGLISWGDDKDTYKFTLLNPTKVSLNIASYINNQVSVWLEDEKGNEIFAKWISDGTKENPSKKEEIFELNKGTYYIHVDKILECTGKYDLSITNVVDLKDVVRGTFYYEPVVSLVSSGVISGFPDGTFRPDTPLTRMHAILLLKRALNLEVPSNYQEIADSLKDVGRNHIYAKEIAAVYQRGIFKGNNNRMGLNDDLTREQMASVIVRAYKLTDNPEINSLGNVLDKDQISPVHQQNVEILYDLNITTGKGNGKYMPKESINRGQFVTFLYRAQNI